MDTLQATYRDDEDDEEEPTRPTTAPFSDSTDPPPSNTTEKDAETSENLSSDDVEKSPKPSENADEEEEDPPPKKQKQLSSLTNPEQSLFNPVVSKLEIDNNSEEPVSKEIATTQTTSGNAKKTKKKSSNVWVTKSTRKGKKKSKGNTSNSGSVEDTVLITPVPRFLDKTDDTPEMKICLSKVYKAEKVELSEDRLSAGSSKGYRMVRATRGVMEGAWYFEIQVVHLGDTGHTRLGWSTEKGDLQAPVGYDGNSFGYRDIDGSKIHRALREKYGEEGYKEGDVIGFYINLPNGSMYAPNAPNLVCYKGQRYVTGRDQKEDPLKVVPGSVMSFFKNGICQGVAFKDLPGGRYYPAASMYTLPNQPNCLVRFNFGPEFEFFAEDFGGHPIPKPMIEVLYHGLDNRAETDASDLNKE